MSDTSAMSEKTVPQVVSASVMSEVILGPLDYGLAASCRRALELGATTDRVVNLLLNHLASVVAMVEPSGAREQLLRDIVGAFAPMVRKHVDARYTTPGGVKLPGAGV